MNNEMNILAVSHYFASHRGGVEIVNEQLVHRFAQRGARVVWAASGPVGTPPPGVTCVPMRAWNFSERQLDIPYPIWSLGSLIKLWRLVSRCNVLLLQDCLYMGNVAAFLFAKTLRKPVAVTQHIGLVPYRNWLPRSLHWVANRTLGRLVLGHADRAVFINQKVEAYFSAFTQMGDRSRYIPNGVSGAFQPVTDDARLDLRRRLGLPVDRAVVLFVGRFNEKKGLRLLRDVARQMPEVAWEFVGWGRDDPNSWGLQQVRSAGAKEQRDIVAYYQAADLLILPSVGEGFPLVIQEAMACGTPVLTSEETRSGMPGSETAIMTAELDVESLVSAVRTILSDGANLPARREDVAEFARSRWNWDDCVEKYMALFRDLMPRSDAPSVQLLPQKNR